MKKSFTLTQIEYVLAVHRMGHFAKAAELCHVTQPTLSMQLQKLENDLGVKIFDRSKKPILLTEVGKRLVDQMQTVLSEARKIERIVEYGKSGELKGELTFGVIPTIAPYVLPRLLPVLEQKYPSVSLTIRELQTHQIIEALQSDEIDVGLLATPIHVPRINEYALFYEPFSVLCQKGHELSGERKIKHSSLKAQDIWLLEEGHCLRHQVLDVCDLKKVRPQARKFTFESGSLETLKTLVDSYGGYTLLPALATDSIGRKSQLVEFERPIPARQVGLVYRREHHKADFIENLGEAILLAIPERIRKLRPKDLDVLPIN